MGALVYAGPVVVAGLGVANIVAWFLDRGLANLIVGVLCVVFGLVMAARSRAEVLG